MSGHAQRAWAVWSPTTNAIVIQTISDTARAARVNWLVACAGIAVFHTATDQQIADAFEQMSAMYPGTLLLEVEVSIPANTGWVQ